MSEPRLISPLLDNFVMGDPISEHDGVFCCPAMRCDTEDKYIIKIISIPASQTQLDALLLAGAYASKDAAVQYFKELSETVVREAQVLQQLSQLEGFVSYEDWQIEPKEDSNGFDVYLRGTYKRTLSRLIQRNAMTHLGAVNLGLDLCAALATCRKSGYLYTDLKPANIYVTDDQRYCIGDLGFLSLDSLKFASLPDKYRSAYTPPEITDAYSALNTTADVYALGLILYQVFNGGKLPFDTDCAQAVDFAPPVYADYEMAEIILKACAAAPEDRWEDPVQMGHALISYMQRNGANDTPIIPQAAPEEPEIPEVVSDAQATEEVMAEADAEPAAEEVPEDTAADAPTDAQAAEEITEVPADEQAAEEDTDIPADEQPAEENAEIPADEQAVQDIPEAADAEEVPPVQAVDEAAAVYNEDSFGNLSFLDDVNTEVAEAELAELDGNDIEISEEVSGMLSQADELLAHPIPEPVVAPEAIEVPMPEPILPEPVTDAAAEEEDVPTEAGAEVPAEPEAEAPYDAPPKKKRRWLRACIAVVLLLALAAGAYGFYEYYYLQNVEELQLSGAENYLTVTVVSDIPDAQLQIVCADTYGNKFPAPVVNGKAEFTELPADRAFTVTAVIEGFHQLTGNYTATYSTPAQTQVIQPQAITGTEDGSAILSFAVEGPDSDSWKVSYVTDGEEVKEVLFNGHTVNLTGLTAGSTYEFTLLPEAELYLADTNKFTFTASNVIRAQALQITACSNGALTAVWEVPEGETVESWSVRCFNDDGFVATAVTTAPTVTFEGIDCSAGYTVEVTAAGMTVSERTSLEAGSVTVTGFTVDTTDPNALVINWTSEGDVSEEGWIMTYSINGEGVYEAAGADNTVPISPALPGCTYSFTVVPADGAPVFGGEGSFETSEAEDFAGYGLQASVITLNMCRTPDKVDWDRTDLKKSDYTTEFTVGQKASFLARTRSEYAISEDSITTLFLIRNDAGEIVKFSTSARAWVDMWWRGYCELDIPAMPDAAGSYTVSVYFNGAFVGEQAFTVQ